MVLFYLCLLYLILLCLGMDTNPRNTLKACLVFRCIKFWGCYTTYDITGDITGDITCVSVFFYLLNQLL
jgi:hypothetical protein